MCLYMETPNNLFTTTKHQIITSCNTIITNNLQKTSDVIEIFFNTIPNTLCKQLRDNILSSVRRTKCDIDPEINEKLSVLHTEINEYIGALKKRECDLMSQLTLSQSIVERYKTQLDDMSNILEKNSAQSEYIDQLEKQNKALKSEVDLYRSKYIEELTKYRLNADKLKILIEQSKQSK